MALTGLAIYKQLPKTNCKDCGLPTCLAFAMKVASGQAGLEGCPSMSDDARAALEEASAPPQKLVTISGEGDASVSIGQETVLFRHEERFHNPTAIAVRFEDTLDEAALKERLDAVGKLSFDRMGRTLSVDMAAIENISLDREKFVRTARTVSRELKLPLVLISSEAAALEAAGEALAGSKPLLYASGDSGSLEAAAAAARKLSLPLGIENASLETLADMAEAASGAGVESIVISPGRDVAPGDVLEFLTQTRRVALKKKFRQLGYPVLTFALGQEDNAVIAACWYLVKYAGIVVVDTVDPTSIVAILTTRFNIYTDPQKPVQVEAKLYEINEPGAEAPIMVTTNFALSYYSVESEVEASRVPSRILAVDTEGTSVLTAWAADKFNPETITEALEKSGAEGTVSHHKVVIPGLVAIISGSLEEASGWEVEVGPKEAVGIASYLTSRWKK